MTLTDAPLFTDVAPGPADGRAYWVQTADQTRIRIATWGVDAPHGTILLFPGRTEYVEKYGTTAGEFRGRGFATLAIDWRGQGLADRLIDNTRIGHIDDFDAYQTDVSAALLAAKSLDLPRPWFLLGHSMGGCIGLRALMNGLDVQSAAFSAPMWGIGLSAPMRPIAWALSHTIPAFGLGNALTPGTKIDAYPTAEPFEDNTLTTDRPMWDMMANQLAAHDELALGGPSIHWLRAALDETAALQKMPAPPMQCVTYLGTNERIVDPLSVHQRMAGWSNGHLEIVQGAEHEVLMEIPATRTRVIDDICARFGSA